MHPVFNNILILYKGVDLRALKKVKGLLVFRSCWTPLKNDFRVVFEGFRRRD